MCGLLRIYELYNWSFQSCLSLVFSNDIKVSESSLLIQLEDTSIIYVDVDIPELYSSFIKENLNVDVKFSGNNDKIYSGIIDSTSGRIDIEKRSLATRIKLKNDNFDIYFIIINFLNICFILLWATYRSNV